MLNVIFFKLLNLKNNVTHKAYVLLLREYKHVYKNINFCIFY